MIYEHGENKVSGFDTVMVRYWYNILAVQQLVFIPNEAWRILGRIKNGMWKQEPLPKLITYE